MTVQAATPGKLARFVRGLTPAQLRKAPAPGEWSINQILDHLAEAEIVIGWRLRSMINSSGAPPSRPMIRMHGLRTRNTAA